MPKIGIGITERNRPDVFKETLDNIQKFLPPNAKLVVVDDASDEPLPDATFRFEKNVGIAVAKNKCLELLDDCDEIFLFDSDTYPVKDKWWQPYIKNREPHLCYIFENLVSKELGDCVKLYEDSQIKAYSHARGCMLYINWSVLDAVGGMETEYGTWGYEHVSWSNRIFNAGLTSFRYMDIKDNTYFYSGDEQVTVKSTVDLPERRRNLAENKPRFLDSFKSTRYVPYKSTLAKRTTARQNNIILTCYFTGQPDPQRGQWDNKIIEDTAALRKSVEGQTKLVILNDSGTDQNMIGSTEFINVETAINPYFQRWISYWQYLRDHPEIDKVFCVDATDVTLVNNPFPYMRPGIIYVGDEPDVVGSQWMRQNHTPLASWIRQNKTLPLLNAGVLGGSRGDVMRFIHQLVGDYIDRKGQAGNGDMGLFNLVAYKYFKDNIVHGRTVTNVFKSYESSGTEWFMHK